MNIRVLALVLQFSLSGFAMAQDPVPEWQTAAGGKMAFEVASVKRVKPGTPFASPNFPLDPGDAYRPTGGRFIAHFGLSTYIKFAYKLMLTQEQTQTMLASLPKWVATDSFDIEAKAASGTPTKDQMRLMMQTLLRERFKLEVHFEIRDSPVLALRLIKPDKPGPKLRPHAEGPACDAPAAGTEVFPPVCDAYMMSGRADGTRMAGSRNTTMQLLASGLPTMERLGRPVVDQTGLEGRVDFVLQWRPEPTGPPAADGVQPAFEGPTFVDALREQLGVKLEPTRAPLQILVVDHVELPTEN